jgi:hypothetical protein
LSLETRRDEDIAGSFSCIWIRHARFNTSAVTIKNQRFTSEPKSTMSEIGSRVKLAIGRDCTRNVYNELLQMTIEQASSIWDGDLD